MNILKYKKIYLLISALVLLPGIISLTLFGLDLSVDFTGGSVLQYSMSPNTVPIQLEVQDYLNTQDINFKSVTVSDDTTLLTIATDVIDTSTAATIRADLEAKYGESLNLVQTSFETVGASIGAQTTKNAFLSIIVASVGIVLYIAYTFRNVPKPYSGLRFGISAIVAMLHDALLVLGVFSILGYFFKVRVDSLFITAVLTVIGFSVHDSIVVFDRIRENLRKLPKSWTFEQIVNYSVVETLNRSISTSLTVLLPLLALFILGGDSLKTFVLALLVGIFSGTYSSIFTASPLLVIWEEYRARPKQSKKSKK